MMRITQNTIKGRAEQAYLDSGTETVEVWIDAFHGRIKIRHPDRPQSKEDTYNGETGEGKARLIVGVYDNRAEYEDIYGDLLFTVKELDMFSPKGA